MQGQPIERASNHVDETPFIEPERRRQGRIPCEDLRCSLGAVLDLSAEGARVLVRKFRAPATHRLMPVEFAGYGITIKLDAMIMRANRIGFSQYDVGLRFDSLTASQKQVICDLVRTHSIRYSIVRAMN